MSDRWQVIHQDCLVALRSMPDCSVDAVVTDPPAGIEFMGAKWDSFSGDARQPDDATFHRSGAGPYDRAKVRHGTSAGYGNRGARDGFIAFMTEVFTEVRRVLKPGGHALVWALPRTSHWTGMALEEAGLECREVIHHLFGSGFPKSRSLRDIGRPELGTALKPSVENWWLVRRPLAASTVAANVAQWSTGALNIDQCRVACSDKAKFPTGYSKATGAAYAQDEYSKSWTCGEDKNPSGRWPSNLVLSHIPPGPDGTGGCQQVGTRRVKGTNIPGKGTNGGVKPGTIYSGGWGDDVPYHYADPDGTEEVADFVCQPGCPVAELDRQSGMSKSPSVGSTCKSFRGVSEFASGRGGGFKSVEGSNGYGDQGGASRYFPVFAGEADAADVVPFLYKSKPSRRERSAGCEDIGGNNHCTVKSISLCRWLVRLVTPPDGIVLDCFAGSASIGCAAILEGKRYIGVEQDERYATIARARLTYWQQQAQAEPAPAPAVTKQRRPRVVAPAPADLGPLFKGVAD